MTNHLEGTGIGRPPPLALLIPALALVGLTGGVAMAWFTTALGETPAHDVDVHPYADQSGLAASTEAPRPVTTATSTTALGSSTAPVSSEALPTPESDSAPEAAPAPAAAPPAVRVPATPAPARAPQVARPAPAPPAPIPEPAPAPPLAITIPLLPVQPPDVVQPRTVTVG